MRFWKTFYLAAFIATTVTPQLLKADDVTSTTVTGGTTAAVTPAPSDSKAIGNIDIRPSWTTINGEFHSENTVEAGYQLNANLGLSGVFYFTTNIDDPTGTPGSLGLNPIPYDLFFRTKISNIADLGGGVSLGYQNRLYLPVNETARDAGMLATMRNYFTLSKQLSSSVKFIFTELPILHVYSMPGVVTAKDGAKANPLFENRFYFDTVISLTKDLTLDLPVMFHVSKAREFAGAKNDGEWSAFAWIYPELDYALNDKVILGVAYYSDNLVMGNLSNTALSEGLEKGVLQFTLQASL